MRPKPSLRGELVSPYPRRETLVSAPSCLGTCKAAIAPCGVANVGRCRRCARYRSLSVYCCRRGRLRPGSQSFARRRARAARGARRSPRPGDFRPGALAPRNMRTSSSAPPPSGGGGWTVPSAWFGADRVLVSRSADELEERVPVGRSLRLLEPRRRAHRLQRSA